MFVYKKTEDLEKMTPAELDQYKNDLMAYEKAEIENKISEKTKAEIELAKAELKDVLSNEISAQLLEKLHNAPEFKHLKSLVKENFESIKDAIKKGSTEDLFVVKAPQIHRTDNNVVTYDTSVNFEVGDNVITDNTIVGIRYPENFILNYIPNRLVSKVPAQYRRIEQVDKEGKLAITPEGEIKPLVDYSFIITATDREKAACRIEWSEEFEYDWEQLYREIVRLLETDCIREWQELILDTIFTIASPYVSSPLDLSLTNPDAGHVAMAGQAQSNAVNYYPNLVLMNPGDWTSLKVTQDIDGKPVVLPHVGENDINGMTAVRSNLIPQGKLYVIDTTIFDEIHGGFMFRAGQYNDQLIRNLYTLIAEVFFILNVAQRDVVGIVELDIEATKLLLKKP